jgi:hypothetical protein
LLVIVHFGSIMKAEDQVGGAEGEHLKEFELNDAEWR